MDSLVNCHAHPELMMEDDDDLNGIVQTIHDLEESCDQHGNVNTILKQNIADLKVDLKKLENIHHEDRMRWEENNLKIQSMQRENKNLQNCVQTRELEISDLSLVYSEVNEAHQEKETLRKNLSQMQTKLKKMKQLNDDMDENAQVEDYTMKRLESSLEQLQHEMTDNRRRNVEDLNKEYQNATHTWEACKKLMEETQIENHLLTQRFHQVELVIHKLEDTTQKNMAQLKQLKLDLTKEQINNEKLQKNVQTLMEDEKQLNRERLQQTEIMVMLQEELDNMSGEMEACRNMLKKKMEELENYRTTITSLKKKIVSNGNNIPLPGSKVVQGTRSRTNKSRGRSIAGQVPRCKSPADRSKVLGFHGAQKEWCVSNVMANSKIIPVQLIIPVNKALEKTSLYTRTKNRCKSSAMSKFPELLGLKRECVPNVDTHSRNLSTTRKPDHKKWR